MEKQIVIDNECRDFLMRVFRCSRMRVWRAMNFVTTGEEARKMRHLALQHGGELVGAKLEEGDTTHEEVEFTMTQRFGKRDGKVERTANGVMAVPEFMEFQKDIQLLAASL